MSKPSASDRELYWRLAESLSATARLVDRRMSSRMDDPVAARTLGLLAEHGPLRPTALAEHLQVSPAAVTRRIQALTRSGQIAIDPDTRDARTYTVDLTDAGRADLETAAAQVAGSLRAQLAAWSEGDITRLTELLERLLATAADTGGTPPATARTTTPWWREP